MKIDRDADNVGTSLVTSAAVGTIEINLVFDDDEVIVDLRIRGFGDSKLDNDLRSAKAQILGLSPEGAEALDPSGLSEEIMTGVLISEGIIAACADYREKII